MRLQWTCMRVVLLLMSLTYVAITLLRTSYYKHPTSNSFATEESDIVQLEQDDNTMVCFSQKQTQCAQFEEKRLVIGENALISIADARSYMLNWSAVCLSRNHSEFQLLKNNKPNLARQRFRYCSYSRALVQRVAQSCLKFKINILLPLGDMFGQGGPAVLLGELFSSLRMIGYPFEVNGPLDASYDITYVPKGGHHIEAMDYQVILAALTNKVPSNWGAVFIGPTIDLRRIWSRSVAQNQTSLPAPVCSANVTVLLAKTFRQYGRSKKSCLLSHESFSGCQMIPWPIGIPSPLGKDLVDNKPLLDLFTDDSFTMIPESQLQRPILLYTKKVRETLWAPVRRYLEEHWPAGILHFDYGQYQQADYLHTLEHNTSFMVVVDQWETQGIFLGQAFARNIPVLINRVDGYALREDNYTCHYPEPCIIPYICPSCGHVTYHKAFNSSFDGFLTRFRQKEYHPIDFWAHRLSPKVSIISLIETFCTRSNIYARDAASSGMNFCNASDVVMSTTKTSKSSRG